MEYNLNKTITIFINRNVLKDRLKASFKLASLIIKGFTMLFASCSAGCFIAYLMHLIY